MAQITAAMVKELREATGLGMMDCKRALEDAGGDMDAAQEALRKKGLATAEKRAERTTAEGVVAINTADDKSSATMVEVQCETDFCARNDEFLAMVQDVLAMAEKATPEGEVAKSDEMNARVQDTLAKIGENMSFSRGVKIKAPRVGTYTHHNQKVGVVVGVDKPDVDEQTLSDLCMHIAFNNPMAITADDIPADVVEKERKILVDQAMESGKPQEIAEKMVEGRMKKFVAENALMAQPFVKDDKKTVAEVLDGATVTAFARFAVGG